MYGDENSGNLPRHRLQKGTTNDSVTDYKQSTSVPVGHVSADYQAPAGRTLGNTVFRRNINGELDYDYAKHVVVDCIHKQKDDALQLTDLERLILSTFFAPVFNYVDPAVVAKMRVIQFRLNDLEIQKVSMLVADHLMREMQYAATPKP